MSVCTIVTYPDSRLKTVCEGVSDVDEAARIAGDLMDTMLGGPPRTVGIAAPQIGELFRVAIVNTSINPKYPPAHGQLILINPVIVEKTGDQTFREGCLSLPEYTANIRRSQRIVVEAFDIDLKPYSVEAVDFEAVVIQHELDHLNGILFLDRVVDLKTDLFPRRAK